MGSIDDVSSIGSRTENADIVANLDEESQNTTRLKRRDSLLPAAAANDLTDTTSKTFDEINRMGGEGSYAGKADATKADMQRLCSADPELGFHRTPGTSKTPCRKCEDLW